MNARGMRRYIDDLLRGRSPKPFAPADFEASQIRTAIDLRAAGQGDAAPREDFLNDLHRRLADQLDGQQVEEPKPTWLQANRRQVIVGTSAAASAAGVAVAADRLLLGDGDGAQQADNAQELTPNDGSWQKVADSRQVTGTGMVSFDIGSVVGFVRRVNGQPEAVSGVCTHQGCKLWFDAPDDRLRCPCHSTSFSPEGEVVTHQLPISPKPLPKLDVREADGSIEVFAPASPTESA